MGKTLLLTEAMIRRVRRADYAWSGGGRSGTCLLCGKGFPDCPHSIAQNLRVLEMTKNADGVI